MNAGAFYKHHQNVKGRHECCEDHMSAHVLIVLSGHGKLLQLRDQLLALRKELLLLFRQRRPRRTKRLPGCTSRLKVRVTCKGCRWVSFRVTIRVW